MADSEDFQLKHSEVPKAPAKDSGAGQEEGHAVAAGVQRQEAAVEGGAGKADPSTAEGVSGAMDDVLEGAPTYPAAEDEEEDEDDEEEEDEEDEDWQFTLPKGTLEDDDDADNIPLAEEGRSSRVTQQGAKGAQVETAVGPADNSNPVSSDGATMEPSKEPAANQVSKEPAEAPLQGPAADAPSLNIKDEPVDEGYDAALLPQSSISKIKEELEHKDEELRISSVFSFRGGSAFAPQGSPVPFTQPTTIFLPGRATLLQASAMASLTVKPRLQAPAPALAPAPAPAPSLLPQPQPQPPPAGISTIRCSGCSKVLVKGQTAFQRKGATQLFCSTVCLSSHLPPSSKARSCYQCNKEIDDPKSMVMVPLDNNTYMHFCSHFCLSVSSTGPDRKKTVAQLLYSPHLIPRIAKDKDKLHCIVCKSTNKIEHEVTHQGHIHSLCSNACFLAWRKSRQLAMNCCEGCGLYCKSDSDVCQTLTVEKAQLHFCSPTCVSTYKQSCMKNTECAICHNSVPVSSTIMERDPMGKVQLYCSTTCIGQIGPAKHMLTGTPFPCSQCNLSKVPQYHLATSDGNIRNFCSYECVSVFRLKKEDSSPQPGLVNGAASSPSYSSSQPPLTDGPLPQAQSPTPPPDRALPSVAYQSPHSRVTSVPPLEHSYSDLASQAHLAPAPPPSPGHALTQGAATTPRQLTCHQCSKPFDTKPLLFSYQGRISMFCEAACCEQYKTQKNIMAQCESCKLENVVFEVMTYNKQDRVFCSQSCKRHFQEEATAGSKVPWRPCSYCSCVSQKMLHSHYSGRVEEFCRPHCMSQYTVLHYGMARCDNCRKQGYMDEKLQCTSSVRNFCTRLCLMQYCYQHFEATGAQHSTNHAGAGHTLPPPHAPSQAHHPSKMNPVVGDVVSLASDSAARPHASGALVGALPTSNNHDKPTYHASTQTDAMRLPAARRYQVKNKSVLCRPFTLNQETMCQLPEPPAKASGADASTMAQEPPRVDPLPARLTGRHFLDLRRGGSVDCVVCAKHSRKRIKEEQEEDDLAWKRRRMEEEEEEKKEESGKQQQKKEEEAEKPKERKWLKEECGAETVIKEERGEPSCRAHETRGLGEGARRQTAYHCKACPGQPALCPAPCFELYHTRLLY